MWMQTGCVWMQMECVDACGICVDAGGMSVDADGMCVDAVGICADVHRMYGCRWDGCGCIRKCGCKQHVWMHVEYVWMNAGCA